jgi:5-methylcytosine-specific restriction enzyme A
MTKRREFPVRIKLAAFQRCGGYCEACDAKLFPGRYAFDHRNPDALTGTPILENCAVLCRPCHADKTAMDMASIAKAKRRQAKHLGIKRAPKGPPLPGTRASGIRKRMSGAVEKWPT